MDSLSHHVSSPAPAFVLAPPQESNSFDVWGVLSRRKWLVFLGLVTGLALGGLFNAQCETIYRSEAKVKIEPRKATVMQITQTNPVAPLSEDFEMRHDRLIGEHNIVRKCLVENSLMDLKSFNDMPEEEVIEYVKDNLYARPDREEKSLYTLRFYCRDQDEVSSILNHLIDTYKSELDLEYSHESDKYKELLRSVDEKFLKNLTDLQNKLLQEQAKYNVPMVSGGTNIHEYALVELGKQIEEDKKILYEWEEVKNSTIRALEAGPEAARSHYYILVQSKYLTDYSYASRDGNQNFIEIEIQKLMSELAAMEGRVAPGHPDFKNMSNRIARLQKWKEETNAISPLAVVDPAITLNQFLMMAQQTIEMKQESLLSASKLYKEHFEEARRLTQIQRQIEAIKEDIERADVYVRSIQQKVIEADPNMQVSQNVRNNEGYNFRIIMPASRGKQSWPILPLILSVGGLLGLLGGFALGCLVELADKTFHNPDEIVKQLNVPLIGHIPVIGQSKRYLVENSLIEPVVCSYHRPKSQVSEAFRAVRTSLFFNTQGKQHSVIQITSPTPGDGKSTLAANLAVSIAQSGKRVLLVDADMRRPRQATTFGITSKTGFATVLTGESDWHDVLYDCPEIEGLTVMPCGAKPNNPAELSSSPQVKELIEEMRLEFDFVIIDSPPLLAVTDACPIAARVDGVILCIRIKKNVRVSAERSTEMLANLGANCIGLVVNGVGAQSGYGSQYTYGAYRAGYSYNGYGYGYGYGYGAGKYYEDDKPSNDGQQASKRPRRIEDQRMEKTSG